MGVFGALGLLGGGLGGFGGRWGCGQRCRDRLLLLFRDGAAACGAAL